METYACQECKIACDRDPSSAGDSKSPKSNFRCTRCRFMDSLPIIKSSSLNEEKACSICLVDFSSETTAAAAAVINELPCRHHFHRKCISEWIVGGSKSSCPLCRYKLPIDYTSTGPIYYSDTMTRPMGDGVRPARYRVDNGDRVWIPPSDHRLVLLLRPDGSGYYVPWPPGMTAALVLSGGRRTTTTTTTTTTSSDHNNTTTLLDEDGDTLMLDA